MANGDGIIIEKRRGVWEVQVPCGKNPITGKYERITRTVKGTKAEAKAVRDEIRYNLKSGLRTDAGKMTFKMFSDTWHETRLQSGDFSPTTMRTEEDTLKLLNAYIGELKLSELNAATVEALYSIIRKDKAEKLGRDVSGSTMLRIHRILKQVLQKAVDYDYILRNPCDRVKAPKAGEPDRHSLSFEEVKTLQSRIDEAEESAYKAFEQKEGNLKASGHQNKPRSGMHGMKQISHVVAVRVALATGMRRGELFGLDWANVDLNHSILHVRQSVTDRGELKPPKSGAGKRSISLDAKTCESLARWQDFQRNAFLNIGLEWDEAKPAFCGDTFARVRVNNFETWWRKFREEAGFPNLLFHELRHSHATLLQAMGVDAKTIQTRLGHYDVSVTFQRYIHFVPENDMKAAELFGGIASGEIKPRETGKLIVLAS